MTHKMVLAAIEELRAEVHALRADLAMRTRNSKTARQARYERRCARLREIANATGLGATWANATAVLLILCGRHQVPAGQERNAQLLQQDPECPKSARGIYRIISEAD